MGVLVAGRGVVSLMRPGSQVSISSSSELVKEGSSMEGNSNKLPSVAAMLLAMSKDASADCAGCS